MVVSETSVVVEHFDMHGCVRVLDRDAERLVPLWIEVLVDNATLVALLAIDLELNVRVTGAYNTYKGKGSLYIAQYPVNWTAQSALYFLPPPPRQTCSFRHQLGFSGKHSSHAAITRNDYSLTIPPESIARYSFIQLSELGCQWKTKMTNLRNGSKGGFEHGLT